MLRLLLLLALCFAFVGRLAGKVALAFPVRCGHGVVIKPGSGADLEVLLGGAKLALARQRSGGPVSDGHSLCYKLTRLWQDAITLPEGSDRHRPGRAEGGGGGSGGGGEGGGPAGANASSPRRAVTPTEPTVSSALIAVRIGVGVGVRVRVRVRARVRARVRVGCAVGVELVLGVGIAVPPRRRVAPAAVGWATAGDVTCAAAVTSCRAHTWLGLGSGLGLGLGLGHR